MIISPQELLKSKEKTINYANKYFKENLKLLEETFNKYAEISKSYNQNVVRFKWPSGLLNKDESFLMELSELFSKHIIKFGYEPLDTRSTLYVHSGIGVNFVYGGRVDFSEREK